MISLNEKFIAPFVRENEVAQMAAEVAAAKKTVDEASGAGNAFLGWRNLPIDYDKEEFARIKVAAKKIQDSCDILVVIGIGGSYLGARAAIEFVKSPLYNNLKKDTPDVYFSGNSISANAMADLLAICEGKDVCINVISKSGTTTEPAITFRIFRELLEKKYGKDGARERIFVTTDRARGTLKAFSDEMGYETFVVPDDIGGRYSVLTAVGLLPIAVAGCDIDEMMTGAAEAREKYLSAPLADNECLRYAAIRNILCLAPLNGSADDRLFAEILVNFGRSDLKCLKDPTNNPNAMSGRKFPRRLPTVPGGPPPMHRPHPGLTAVLPAPRIAAYLPPSPAADAAAGT